MSLAFANHQPGGTPRNLQVIPEEPEPNSIGSIHVLTATVSETAESPLTIYFEVESGPEISTDDNPTQDSGTTVTIDDGASHSTPDMTCTIAGEGTTCTVEFTATQTGTNLIRAWVEHDGNLGATSEIDTQEGRISDDYEPGVLCTDLGCVVPTNTTTDCVAPDPPEDCEGTEVPGNVAEPDSTDVVEKTWVTGTVGVDLQPEFATNTVFEQHVLTATVSNEAGQAISGTPVAWTMSGEGSFVSFETVTDQNGQANATITSTEPGRSTVTATSDSASDSATKDWTAGEADQVVLEPETSTNTVGEDHVLTATAEDNLGNPARGAPVTWTMSGQGNFVSFEAVTDQNGQANATITSETPGRSTVTATSDGASDSATKVWVESAPSTVTVTPESATNTVGENHVLTATVVDEFGNPIPGGLVTWTMSGVGSFVSSETVTDENGQANATITSTEPGRSTVTATSDGESDSAIKDWKVEDPETLDCDDANGDGTVATDDHETNPVDGPGSSETYECTVRDEFGNPVPGAQVVGENETTVNDPDGTPEGASYDSPDYGCVTLDTGTCTVVVSPVDDEAGTAVICFAVTTTGTDFETACSTETVDEVPEGNDLTDKVEKTWAFRTAAGLDLQPETATNPVGSEHTITATVYDQFGDTFEAFTDVDFEFFAGSSVDGDGNDTTTADDTCNTAGGSTCTITYSGTTASGEDLICGWLEGQTPTMAGSSPDGSCDDPDADVPAETRQDSTGDDGTPSPANDSVDVVQKTWAAGAPSTVTVTPEEATNTVGENHVLTATVVDEFGNPVPGAPVTWSMDGVGSFVSFETVTDQNGQANATITSTEPGRSTVTATSDGESDSAIKDWTVGDAARVDLQPPSESNQVGTNHVLTATVYDAFDNPVPDAPVTWTMSGEGNFVSSEIVTDENGQANATITSETPGRSTVTATSENGASDSATKDWTVGDVDRVELEPESETNTVGETHVLTATVFDEFNNPIPGALVTWTMSGVGTFVSSETVTDQNGQANATITSTEPGRSTVTVTSANGSTATATKVWAEEVEEEPEPEEPGPVDGSGPDAASWQSNRIDVVVRGTDDAIYHRWWDGTAWHGYESLGGEATSDPSTVSWGPNRLDIFVRGTDNALWHRWYENGIWYGWESLGGVLTSAPDVSSWGPNRLDVFARGTDGQLYHRWWDGSTWQGWEGLGGQLTSGPSAVSWDDNRIDVFVRGTDNALWHAWWDGIAWRGYESLGGVLTSDPDVASWGPNRLDVFVRGTDNQLWHRWYDGANGWFGYAPREGVLTGPPGAVSWGFNRIDVFVRGTDAALWHNFWNGAAWQGYESLGGQLQ